VTVVLVGVTDDVTTPAVPKAGLFDEGITLSCLSLDR